MSFSFVALALYFQHRKRRHSHTLVNAVYPFSSESLATFFASLYSSFADVSGIHKVTRVGVNGTHFQRLSFKLWQISKIHRSYDSLADKGESFTIGSAIREKRCRAFRFY